MLSFLAGLNQTQTKSALGLRAALSSKRQSVSELLRTNIIHRQYLGQGGRNGPFGYPTSEVQFEGLSAARSYRGGEIRVLDATMQPGLTTLQASVTFVGAKCLAQSNEISAHDEPYFTVSLDLADGSPTTTNFGPFENTDEGTEIGVGAIVKHGFVPNPTSLRVMVYENDEGNPDDTAKKIQDEIVKLSKAAQELASSGSDLQGADAADGPGIGPTAAAGTVGAIAAGPFGALIASGIVSVFGLGDDFVGQDGQVLFQKPEEVKTQPAQGQFHGSDFNLKFTVNGGNEGSYDLFFFVQVETVTVQTH